MCDGFEEGTTVGKLDTTVDGADVGFCDSTFVGDIDEVREGSLEMKEDGWNEEVGFIEFSSVGNCEVVVDGCKEGISEGVLDTISVGDDFCLLDGLDDG